MKVLITAALLISTASSCPVAEPGGTVKLRLVRNELPEAIDSSNQEPNYKEAVKEMGRAVWTTTLKETGGKEEFLLMTLGADFGGKRFVMKRTYYPDGSVQSFHLDEFGPGEESPAKTTEITLTARTAQIEVRQGETVEKGLHQAPFGKSQARPNEFWFLKTKPKKGATIEYVRFHEFEMKWIPVTATYVGDKTMVIEKRKFQTHIIRTSDGVNTFLDDQGLPVMLVEPGQRFERLVEKADDQDH